MNDELFYKTTKNALTLLRDAEYKSPLTQRSGNQRFLITIDGPDGTGKTTMCNLLVEFLKKLGINAQYYRQPTGLYYQFVTRKDSSLSMFERCLGLYADTVNLARDWEESYVQVGIVDRTVYNSMFVYNFPYMKDEEIRAIWRLFANSKDIYVPDLSLVVQNEPFVQKDDGNVIDAIGNPPSRDSLSLSFRYSDLVSYEKSYITSILGNIYNSILSTEDREYRDMPFFYVPSPKFIDFTNKNGGPFYTIANVSRVFNDIVETLGQYRTKFDNYSY